MSFRRAKQLFDICESNVTFEHLNVTCKTHTQPPLCFSLRLLGLSPHFHCYFRLHQLLLWASGIVSFNPISPIFYFTFQRVNTWHLEISYYLLQPEQFIVVLVVYYDHVHIGMKHLTTNLFNGKNCKKEIFQAAQSILRGYYYFTAPL